MAVIWNIVKDTCNEIGGMNYLYSEVIDSLKNQMGCKYDLPIVDISDSVDAAIIVVFGSKL